MAISPRAERDLATTYLDLIAGNWVTGAAFVAAELGLANHLRRGAKTTQQLASLTRTHPRALGQLARALAAAGFLREQAGDRFSLRPMGRFLADGEPVSFRNWTRWWGGPLYQEWGHLLYSVRTGRSARRHLTGRKGFDLLALDPERARTFHAGMAELTGWTARTLAAMPTFRSASRIVDVGGGLGQLLIAILRANPKARGVLLELPSTVPAARRNLRAARVAARCEVVPGDFFKEVPAGADTYLLKSVLHDWPDAKARAILRTCRRAMRHDSRLLVIERILPRRTTSSPAAKQAARTDLTMLVAHGAGERRAPAFRTLLQDAGFRVRRIAPAGAGFHVIDARRESTRARHRQPI